MFIDYLQQLFGLGMQIQCSCQEETVRDIDVNGAVNQAIGLLKQCKSNGRKVMWIGNGGSAAIAAHGTIDCLRTAGIRAIHFFDSQMLTCFSNDFGYSQVFAKPISLLADPGDILLAISSSGKSENILQAVRVAKDKGSTIVTLSGFSPDNPLFKQGHLNFYVPSVRYGQVELLHGILCHAFIDVFMQQSLMQDA